MVFSRGDTTAKVLGAIDNGWGQADLVSIIKHRVQLKVLSAFK
jgi:hypothetical protein